MDCNPSVYLSYGNILTKLMSVAVQNCEDTSNLFVLWTDIAQELRRGVKKPMSYLFGFRKEYVDGTDSIAYAFGVCNGIAMADYKQIWRLDICPKKGYHLMSTAMHLYQVKQKDKEEF